MKFHYLIKQYYLGLIIILVAGSHLSAQSYTVISPNGSLKIALSVSATIQYSVERDKEAIISPSAISMSLSNGLILGKDGTVANTSTRSNSETISRLYGKSTTLTANIKMECNMPESRTKNKSVTQKTSGSLLEKVYGILFSNI